MQNESQERRNVLIVDNDPAIRRLFQSLFAQNYCIREAATGEDAIEAAAAWPPDLVLLDIMLPGIDGYETCRRLKGLPAAKAAQVIMVSARSTQTELADAFAAGADDYLVKPINPAEILSRVDLHFRLRDSQAATEALQQQVDRHHAALKRATAERTEEILAVQDVAVFTLAKVAESRDNETGQHVLRLREYAQRLAHELAFDSPYAGQIDNGFLADLFRSSPLHDIGKVGVPDAILLKPGRLTTEEFEIMKRHTTIGGNILNEAVLQAKGGGFLTMAATIARFHHERWDGTGYPAGLVADEIPLPAHRGGGRRVRRADFRAALQGGVAAGPRKANHRRIGRLALRSGDCRVVRQLL